MRHVETASLHRGIAGSQHSFLPVPPGANKMQQLVQVCWTAQCLADRAALTMPMAFAACAPRACKAPHAEVVRAVQRRGPAVISAQQDPDKRRPSGL